MKSGKADSKNCNGTTNDGPKELLPTGTKIMNGQILCQTTI